jgi:hypothetical protein
VIVAGPCAGHAVMRTAAAPAGRLALGTFNNCASGVTPGGAPSAGRRTATSTPRHSDGTNNQMWPATHAAARRRATATTLPGRTSTRSGPTTSRAGAPDPPRW